MSIVIDASVAVKWVLPEPRSEAALELWKEQLIAPVIWLAEAANAIWRHVRLGELDADQALARLAELRTAPVASLAIEPHLSRALNLAIEIAHPVYDCIYLAVALDHQVELMTDDRRFAAAVARRTDLADRVRLLGA